MPEDIVYPIKIEAEGSAPAFDGELRRINIILGANGTGKSSLLRWLRENVGLNGLPDNVIYVEGGRTVSPPNNLRTTRANFNRFNSLDSAEQHHSGLQSSSLKDRVTDAFMRLYKKGEYEKSQHSDEVTKWNRGARNGPLPERNYPPLDELFDLFNSVFPEITLELDIQKLNIKCNKGGKEYSPSQLSDGERQTLCLLADIALLAEENSLIIVDEPELNLHPHLAEELWNTIELRYPNCVFVYATHNIAFSLRPSVEAAFILAGSEKPVLAVGSPFELDTKELRPFLGAIPAILVSDRCLLVEGLDKSFDIIFYRWLLDMESLVIEPLGSSSEVLAATKGSGVWGRIAPSTRVIGVIDRDYQSDQKLKDIAGDNLVVLDFHEAESYLCHPKIIFEVASSLGTLNKISSVREIENIIFEFAKNTLHAVVAKRSALKLALPLTPSLIKQQADRIQSDEKLMEEFTKACEVERNKAINELNGEEVQGVLKEELKYCRKIIEERKIDEVLKIFEGKELLNKLHSKAGCNRPDAVVRAAAKHLKIEDYAHLRNLQKTLCDAIS